MNERIDKLFGQALDEAVSETWTTLDADQLSRLKDKFAELVVTDVIDILTTYRTRMIFDDGFEYNCEHPINAIRKHFGVKP